MFHTYAKQQYYIAVQVRNFRTVDSEKGEL